jgi:hypothetical protein
VEALRALFGGGPIVMIIQVRGRSAFSVRGDGRWHRGADIGSALDTPERDWM